MADDRHPGYYCFVFHLSRIDIPGLPVERHIQDNLLQIICEAYTRSIMLCNSTTLEIPR